MLAGAARFLQYSTNSKSTEGQGESESSKILAKLSKHWPTRAMVRKFDFNDLPLFDSTRPDFLETLLPFSDSAIYRNASEEMKSKVLTCGWLIYNQKTLSIETDIITPACNLIINGGIPGLVDRNAKQVAAETAVDESFHSLLVLRANQFTKEARGLDVTIPTSDLVSQMNTLREKQDSGWKDALVVLSTAIVSEVFISNYLKKLSDDHTIQPLNRLTVYTHRVDEISHGNAFREIAKIAYDGLNTEQKDFFCEILPKPVTWFASKELNIWEKALTEIGFVNANDMINECRRKSTSDLSTIDYSGIVELANDIGVTSNPVGISSFHGEGLIHEEKRRCQRGIV